jgi:hypothetical protein
VSHALCLLPTVCVIHAQTKWKCFWITYVLVRKKKLEIFKIVVCGSSDSWLILKFRMLDEVEISAMLLLLAFPSTMLFIQ